MSRLKNEGGQAIVEFTLILPIFVGLIFVAIGYGITLNNYLRVTDIARVAARAASVANFSGDTPPCVNGKLSGSALAAATAAAGGLRFANPPTCQYPDGQQDAGHPIEVTVEVQSQNVINNIPFLSVALPATLKSDATVVVQ